MRLIVGLGNPGSKYAGNRHNVGFMALDAIAERHGLPAWRKRFQGLATDGEIDGERVVLLKPQTYMNESGRAVGEAARFLKITTADVIVLHDELDLEPGKLKVKTGGGNAGHNGLRSITAHLDNEYVRVRLGIGHPGHKDLVSSYVLHDFAKADADWLRNLLDSIADAAGWLAKGEPARFTAAVALSRGETAPASTDGEKAARRANKTKKAPGPAEVSPPAPLERPSTAPVRDTHPAGERQSKRLGALAENLRKWLDRRGGES
ncbi:MAG: aminoacyl-tRNA hydrolase [Hyphomicrobiaceae bacterium]